MRRPGTITIRMNTPLLSPEHQTLIDDMIIKGKDITSINSVIGLKYLQTVRMDPNISDDNYSMLLQDAVTTGVITMDTAEDMTRPSYINNPNFKYVDEFNQTSCSVITKMPSPTSLTSDMIWLKR